MSAKVEELAILFAEVSGGAALYASQGETTAFELVRDYLALLKKETARHEGTFIKTIGGAEIMSSFPTADLAAEASISMQERANEDLPAAIEGKPTNLGVRIGFNHGPVIPKGIDVFGDAVNVAARMMQAAKSDQILTTADTANALAARYRAMTRLVDRLPVKGKAEPMEIYELVWEEEGSTRMATGVIPDEIPQAKLTLRYRDTQVVLDHNSRPFMLGRGKQVDLQVHDEDASRVHLKIECQRGKFIVEDDSVNGTFVITPQGDFRLGKKETLTLAGDGFISLGREVDDNPERVSFSCE